MAVPAWFNLVIMCALGLALPAGAEGYPFQSCHMELGTPHSASLRVDFKISAPHLSAHNWVLVTPSLPQMPYQTETQTRLALDNSPVTGSVANELSSEHRALLTANVPADNSELENKLSGNCQYQAMLSERHLRLGPGSEPVQELSPSDRALYLAETETINFKDPTFQQFLQANHLIKAASQRELDFAWQAFQKIRDLYSYKYDADQDRHASAICQDRATDCGGLAWLFEAVLRANGVPARSLIGRWADAHPSKQPLQGAHVKSEFYADGVGWVPVELSGAVSSKSSPGENYFGQDSGHFLTLHIDPDLLVDTVFFGQKKVQLIQSPIFWATGAGNFDDASSDNKWRTQKL